MQVSKVDESLDFPSPMVELSWNQLIVLAGTVWLIPSRQTLDGPGHTADPTATADAIIRRRPPGGVLDHGVDGRNLLTGLS